jgi:hypothetical protein
MGIATFERNQLAQTFIDALLKRTESGELVWQDESPTEIATIFSCCLPQGRGVMMLLSEFQAYLALVRLGQPVTEDDMILSETCTGNMAAFFWPLFHAVSDRFAEKKSPKFPLRQRMLSALKSMGETGE